MIKSIFFWGGVTTHCYELAKSISRYYEVWAIFFQLSKKEKNAFLQSYQPTLTLLNAKI